MLGPFFHSMTEHEKWMAHAIKLSKKGEGLVEPNPMVGCVLVKDGQMIGQGWHQKFGGPHAEVEAIRSANDDDKVKGSTAYVSLEPCFHHGKTPPCSDLLTQNQVKEVYIACQDPNPKVSGKGIEKLRSAGILVHTGLLENQARQVLAPFLKGMVRKLPWMIAKWAMSLDGKIACHTGHSRWITGSESRSKVHQIRSRVDGVMVGSGTALADDPMLNFRSKNPEENPRRVASRIIVDRRLRIHDNSQLVQTAKEIPVIIATSSAACPKKKVQLRNLGCQLWEPADGSGDLTGDDLQPFLYWLYEQGMTNILVEGGGHLLGTLFDREFIDEVIAFIAPKIIGGMNSPTPVAGKGFLSMEHALNLQNVRTENLGQDILIQGQVKK